MNPWFGNIAFIVGFFAVGQIRDPYIKKGRLLKIVDNRKSRFEMALIAIVAVGSVGLPALWMIFDIFWFANYPLRPWMFGAGVSILIFSLWLFKRSHDDLGTNWSVSLELKENHRLVDTGIYKTIRHPMYTALFLYSAAQAFLLSNWIVGPSAFSTFSILYFMRVRTEEKMMIDKFGTDYQAYILRTNRLLPRLRT